MNMIVIFAALFASALIIWGVISLVGPFIGQIFGERQTSVQIPQFTNMNYENVLSQYGDSEYFYFVTEYDENKNKADGIILEQDPSPESEQIFRGEKFRVILTVNKLKETSTHEDDEPEEESSKPLKNYVGKKYDSVKAELAELYSKVKIVERYDDSVAKGQILSQSVPSGSSLEKGETLVITVSTDKKPDEPETKPEENENNEDKPNEDTPQQAYRKRLTVYGPTDKDSALVEVKVNGKTIKSIELSKGASDVVTIQSTLPSVKAEIYYDGKLVHTETVKMTK